MPIHSRASRAAYYARTHVAGANYSVQHHESAKQLLRTVRTCNPNEVEWGTKNQTHHRRLHVRLIHPTTQRRETPLPCCVCVHACLCAFVPFEKDDGFHIANQSDRTLSSKRQQLDRQQQQQTGTHMFNHSSSKSYGFLYKIPIIVRARPNVVALAVRVCASCEHRASMRTAHSI